MKLAIASSTPACVVLQLVEECNLRCTMCYEWGDAGAYHERPELATLDLDVALRVIRDCAPARPTFELFGGEPLLHPGIWDVIAEIRRSGCEVAFPTNGTLLEKHADQLVESAPNRIWISLDGPERENDAQRGRGVFRRVMRGLAALVEAKRAKGATLPELGVTCVVTPANQLHIANLFLELLDLSQFQHVSIELQSFATEAQYREYARMLLEHYGVPAAPHAKAYVRDPALFAVMEREAIVEQLQRVRAACGARGIRFHSQPRTITVENIDRYFRGSWTDMADKRTRCAVPWKYAEVSARGDVTTCHSFYDLAVGNVHRHSILDIWNGERLEQLRTQLRGGLLPICTACCRYYQ